MAEPAKIDPTKQGWIGVDLDGTLAEYHTWDAWNHFGKPIPLMVDRVKKWLAQGIEVRVVTARAGHTDDYTRCFHTNALFTPAMMVDAIQDWTEKHIGARLPVTNKKDYLMMELWDDRAIRVETNTGKVL